MAAGDQRNDESPDRAIGAHHHPSQLAPEQRFDFLDR